MPEIVVNSEFGEDCGDDLVPCIEEGAVLASRFQIQQGPFNIKARPALIYPGKQSVALSRIQEQYSAPSFLASRNLQSPIFVLQIQGLTYEEVPMLEHQP